MIAREQMVTQSVQDYVRDGLTSRSYAADDVEILDSFPYRQLNTELRKTYVAAGFNFDDGGTPAEMGSDLIRRTYTIELFVFGLDETWGENVAQIVRGVLLQDNDLIPLKDYDQAGAPVIDQMEILLPGGVRVERVAVRDPKPWEENLWLVRAKVTDEYDAGAII